jgi:nucleoside-diphosphate-sugar epimerase
VEKINTPNLLVIGGTGFIGHHLLKASLKKKWQVYSVSLNPPTKERFVEGVRYLHLDLMDRALVEELLSEDFDYVVNLGGYINHQLFRDGGRLLIETHFNALQNLVEILSRHKLKRFVQIGSSDEYGNAPAPQHEELREQPISPYSFAKVACTHFLQMLHRTENFPAVILRLFLTYGPGQEATRFLPQVILGCLEDESFPVSGGEQLRDFCYVDDTVEAIMKALRIPGIEGNIFNVASGEAMSIRAILEEICNRLGIGKPQYGEVPYRAGENMELYANVNNADTLLQWRASTSLDEGLQKTIDWFAQ